MESSEEHYAVCVLVESPDNKPEEVEAAITTGRLTDAVWERIREDGKKLLEADPPQDPRFAAVLVAATVEDTFHSLKPDEYLEFMDYLATLGWNFRSRYHDVMVPFVKQEDELPQQVEEINRRGITEGEFHQSVLMKILNDGVNRGWNMQREYLKEQTLKENEN